LSLSNCLNRGAVEKADQLMKQIANLEADAATVDPRVLTMMISQCVEVCFIITKTTNSQQIQQMHTTSTQRRHKKRTTTKTQKTQQEQQRHKKHPKINKHNKDTTETTSTQQR
jgi:hypothetical protein